MFETIWTKEELETARPPERLTIAEWAERNIVLGGDSEVKGPYRLKWTPYARGIFELVQTRSVEQIVTVKSAQIGFTTISQIIRLYRALQQGKSGLITYADEKTAVKVIENKFLPLINSSPGIAAQVSRKTQYTVHFRNGTHIDIAWGSSVAAIATFEYPDVDIDEADKPGYSRSSQEADAITNVIQRTETFFDKLISIFSTPTNESGNIAKRFQDCDVIYDFHVPCPECGQYQPLIWSQKHTYWFKEGKYTDLNGKIRDLGGVFWEGGLNATPDQIAQAGYKCGECGTIWSSIEKNQAVEKYIMVAREVPEYPPVKIGIHIWRIYSLLGRSGYIPKLVTDWIDAQGDPEKLQGFINSTLAEPWKTVVKQTSEIEILKSIAPDLDPQTVPEAAIALTCGIDIQQGYMVYDVWAWAEDWTSWLIDFGQLVDWDDLEQILYHRTYQGKDQQFNIWRCGIDIKGGIKRPESVLTSTDEAYFWIQKNKWRGVELYACIGASNPLGTKVKQGNVIEKTPSGHNLPGGVQIFMLDIHQNNLSLLQRLKNADPEEPNKFQPAYLHNGTSRDWAYHITGLELQLNNKGIQEWVKVHRHDHFDASKIAHVLADFQWPKGGLNILSGRRFMIRPGQIKQTSNRAHQSLYKDKPSMGRVINPWKK